MLFTVKNKFLFVLCLFDPIALDMLDHMWAGDSPAGNASGCMFAQLNVDRRYGGRKYVRVYASP